MKKLRIRTILIVGFLSILSINSCTSTSVFSFVDTDIVFQNGDYRDPKIGFVNSDGSDYQLIDTEALISKPVIFRGYRASFAKTNLYDKKDGLKNGRNR